MSFRALVNPRGFEHSCHHELAIYPTPSSPAIRLFARHISQGIFTYGRDVLEVSGLEASAPCMVRALHLGFLIVSRELATGGFDASNELHREGRGQLP
jgi:hypothetical protein